MRSHLPALAARSQPFLPARATAHGSRVHVHLADGDVTAYLVLAGYDRRADVATYALRVLNQSAQPLRARLSCVRNTRDAAPAYPFEIDVAPFCLKELLMPVRLSETGPYDRAIVEVEGGEVTLHVEAPAPPLRAASASRWVAWGAVGALATLVLAFGTAAATPRIATLDAPRRALAGSTLDVPYRLSGVASLQYDVRARDGEQIAAGVERARTGVLHVRLPRMPATYRIRVVAAGPLGAQESDAVVVAQAPAKAREPVAHAAAPLIPAPLVADLDVRPSPALAGQAIRVAYQVTAPGTIWLLDLSGRIWATHATSPAGVTWLHVPRAAAGRQMRVVLHVDGASGGATAGLALGVVPDRLARVASIAGNGGSRAASQDPASVTLSRTRVAPGESITVTLGGRHGDARVTLADARGTTIAEGDVPEGQDAVQLTAPDVSVTTTYYVIASVTQGVSQQSIVRQLVVAPR